MILCGAPAGVLRVAAAIHHVLYVLYGLAVAFLDMADQLTITSLIFAVRHHTLAVVVLVLQPSLWSHYGPNRSRLLRSGTAGKP